MAIVTLSSCLLNFAPTWKKSCGHSWKELPFSTHVVNRKKICERGAAKALCIKEKVKMKCWKSKNVEMQISD